MTFTDGPTYTQLSAVDALTTGTLTYTSLSGTAAQLAANADSYVAGESTLLSLTQQLSLNSLPSMLQQLELLPTAYLTLQRT